MEKYNMTIRQAQDTKMIAISFSPFPTTKKNDTAFFENKLLDFVTAKIRLWKCFNG